MHPVAYVGGASYCMLALLKAVDRSLYEPVALLKKEGPLAVEIRKLGIDVHFFESPAVPYNQPLWGYKVLASYYKTKKAQKDFASLLSSLNIDIVYLNNMMLYPYLKTAKEIGCKTIMHVREHWPHKEHQLQMRRARRFADKYADALIAINEFSASMFPECTNKTSIIHDWIDFSDRFESTPFSEIFGRTADDLKVMLYTGGLARIKGTLEIVKIFSKYVLGEEYRLLMIGAGLDYHPKLRGLIGFFERILMFFGWKPYGYKTVEAIKKDKRIVCLPPTYKIVDIFKQSYCMLSYFTIPHANLALAEAIALGTVSIAAKTEESFEYSDNGEGAVLYGFKNKKDFVKKINYVLAHYEEIKDRVMKHSDNISQKFSRDSNATIFNKVLYSVMIK